MRLPRRFRKIPVPLVVHDPAAEETLLSVRRRLLHDLADDLLSEPVELDDRSVERGDPAQIDVLLLHEADVLRGVLGHKKSLPRPAVPGLALPRPAVPRPASPQK